MKSFSVAAALALSSALALAQAPAAPTERLRGSVVSFDASTLVMKERSGQTVALSLDEKFSVNEVVPIEVGAIKSGSYIGTAAQTQPDGSLRALEVLVFPEPQRGTGEGHRPWDLEPNSTMTNATIAELDRKSVV